MKSLLLSAGSAILLFVVPAVPQQTDSIPPSLFVDCGRSTPSKTVEVYSTALIAKRGGTRARVRVQSEPFPTGSGCYNNSSLLVTGPGGSKFREILTQKPKSIYLSGIGMNPVDWSPDGRQLLLEVWRWNTQPNDAAVDKEIWIVEARSGKARKISLDQFVSDQPKKNCGVEFDHLGFTEDGMVTARIHVVTVYDEGDDPKNMPPGRRCSESVRIWAFNPKSSARTQLQGNFVPARYSDMAQPVE